MGMESFNAEPVVPDESERIDDVAKAEEMARASQPHMDVSIGLQKVASGETPIESNDAFKQVEIANGMVDKHNINKTDKEIREESGYYADKVKEQADKVQDWAANNYDKNKEGGVE